MGGEIATIIILKCNCDEHLKLAVNTDTRKIMALCPKCKTTFEIMTTELSPKDILTIAKNVEKEKKIPATLFYTRCTDILK